MSRIRKEDRDTGLTDQQKLFVEEYLVDFNAKKATIRAGYLVENPLQYGGKLMKMPTVVAAIKKAQEARMGRTKITADAVLRETASLAFSDIRKLFRPEDFEMIPPTELPDDVAPAITSVKKKVMSLPGGGEVTTWEYTFYDKTKALEKLFRHLGLYNDTNTLEIGDKLASLLKVIDGKGVPTPNSG
jgi:phage terminase small subunit